MAKWHIVLVAACLSMSSQGQVRRNAKMEKAAATSEDSVKIFVIPVQVRLAADRLDEGWFLILADPANKTFWWRFQTGSSEKAAESGAAEFSRSCKSISLPGELTVFCATNRRIMIAASRRTYSNESDLSRLVQAEFDRKASSLDSGLDYFDQVHNLWPVLGSDFFLKKGHAQSAGTIQFDSIKKLEDGWELIVSAIPGKAAQIRLSRGLAIVNHRLIDR